MSKPMTLDDCKRVIEVHADQVPAVLTHAAQRAIEIAEFQAGQISQLVDLAKRALAITQHQAERETNPGGMHRCAADGCTTEIPHYLAMCWVHWRSVPRDLQKVIMLLHRHSRHSAEYRTALQDAVQAVARVEAHKVTL